jgi:hypothetical protein
MVGWRCRLAQNGSDHWSPFLLNHSSARCSTLHCSRSLPLVPCISYSWKAYKCWRWWTFPLWTLSAVIEISPSSTWSQHPRRTVHFASLHRSSQHTPGITWRARMQFTLCSYHTYDLIWCHIAYDIQQCKAMAGIPVLQEWIQVLPL